MAAEYPLVELDAAGLAAVASHIADSTAVHGQLVAAQDALQAAIDDLEVATAAALSVHAGDTSTHGVADMTALATFAYVDAGLALAEKFANKGAASGYAPLDAGSKVPTAFLPALAITSVQVAASEGAQLALTVQEGDVVVRSDQSRSYIRNAGTAGTMADFNELLGPPDLVQSVNGQVGTVNLTAGDVGAPTVVAFDAHIAATGNGAHIPAGGILNANVAGAAGIGYSKLALTGSIVEADLAFGVATQPELDAVAAAAAAALTAHNDDLTGVHGIADTTKLARTDVANTFTATQTIAGANLIAGRYSGAAGQEGLLVGDFGYGEYNVFGIRHAGVAGVANYALGQTSAGYTILNAAAGQSIALGIGEVNAALIEPSGRVAVNKSLLVQPGAAGTIAAAFKMHAGQTADGWQQQNSAGGVLARFDASGRLGIGAAPTQPLEVQSSAAFYASLKTTSSTGYSGLVAFNDAGPGDNLGCIMYGTAATGTFAGLPRAGLALIAGYRPSAMGVGTETAAPLVFITTSVERMRIDSAGLVGIGAASPGARLHVVNATAGQPVASLKMAAAQTADGFQVKDSADAVKFAVSSTGAATIAGALDHDGTTVGFYGVTPVARAAAIASPLGLTTADLKVAVDLIRVALTNIGITL